MRTKKHEHTVCNFTVSWAWQLYYRVSKHVSIGHSRTATVGLLRDKIKETLSTTQYKCKLLQGHLHKLRVQGYFFFLDLLIEVKIPDRISNKIHRSEGSLALTLDHNCTTSRFWGNRHCSIWIACKLWLISHLYDRT